MQDGSSPVIKGQTVDAGIKIGVIGNTTGCRTSTGIHLHFQVERFSVGKWHVTDPFGWDYSSGDDPLAQFNGESSQNLWVNGIPTSSNGVIGVPPASPPNGQYMGGGYIQDDPPSPSEPPPPPDPEVIDSTPPSASGYSASVSGGTANLTTSGVQDNSGGSGVREVRFSAKYNDVVGWRGIGTAASAPYSLSWDMCASGVPDGDVELGMEVWDNANNKWVWSQHFNNPHITKSSNCNPPPAQDGVYLYSNTGLSGSVCYVTQDAPSLGDYCGSGWWIRDFRF